MIEAMARIPEAEAAGTQQVLESGDPVEGGDFTALFDAQLTRERAPAGDEEGETPEDPDAAERPAHETPDEWDAIQELVEAEKKSPSE